MREKELKTAEEGVTKAKKKAEETNKIMKQKHQVCMYGDCYIVEVYAMEEGEDLTRVWVQDDIPVYWSE